MCLLPEGVSALGGVCSRGVSAPEGVWSQEGCLLPGLCSGGGVCSQGGSAPRGSGGYGIPECTETETPLPPCGQTDAYKNITFATSLLTVNITHRDFIHFMSAVAPILYDFCIKCIAVSAFVVFKISQKLSSDAQGKSSYSFHVSHT